MNKHQILFIDEVFQSIRKDYQVGALEEQDLPPSPIALLSQWLASAYQAQVPEPNAFTLATVDRANHPNARVVLLKAIDQEKLLFFTNYQSQKAQELEQNMAVSLVFFWPQLERQIRIKGQVQKTSKEISTQYFSKRPIKSQIGALVSRQSSVIANRQIIEQELEQLTHRYSDTAPECPEFWGGYQVIPDYYEFWQGRSSRLHDRLVYQAITTGWHTFRLSP